LAYYFDNREAIWQCIREDEDYAASVKQQLTAGPVVIPAINADRSCQLFCQHFLFGP
jgi:hypothetical protein